MGFSSYPRPSPLKILLDFSLLELSAAARTTFGSRRGGWSASSGFCGPRRAMWDAFRCMVTFLVTCAKSSNGSLFRNEFFAGLYSWYGAEFWAWFLYTCSNRCLNLPSFEGEAFRFLLANLYQAESCFICRRCRVTESPP